MKKIILISILLVPLSANAASQSDYEAIASCYNDATSVQAVAYNYSWQNRRIASQEIRIGTWDVVFEKDDGGNLGFTRIQDGERTPYGITTPARVTATGVFSDSKADADSEALSTFQIKSCKKVGDEYRTEQFIEIPRSRDPEEVWYSRKTESLISPKGYISTSYSHVNKEDAEWIWQGSLVGQPKEQQ